MSRTLKNMLNSVLSRSGFLQRTNFAGSTDPDNLQMVEFANKAAQYILDYAAWGKLRTTATITMSSGTLTYALPSDFSQLVPESAWGTSGPEPVEFPTSDQLWGYLQAQSTTNATSFYAKIIGSNIKFDAVSDGEVVQYDYISNAPIQDADTSYKTRFDADTDTFVLDEECLLLGTAWAWKAEKGIETADLDRKMFLRALKAALTRDKGAKTIRTGSYGYTSPVADDYRL